MDEERLLELMSAGMNCAQVVLQMVALDVRGEENPELIRAIGAMGYGMGCQFTCGALAGGNAAMAFYAHDSADLMDLCKKLGTWFSERFGGEKCSDIIGEGMGAGPMCRMAVQEVIEKCFELIGDRI